MADFSRPNSSVTPDQRPGQGIILSPQDRASISLLDANFFDHDGVIVINSEQLAQHGSSDMLDELFPKFGLKPPPRHVHAQESAGRAFSESLLVYTTRLPQLKLSSNDIEYWDRRELGAVINRLRESAEPAPHLFDVLDILEEAQVASAVVSSSVRERIYVAHQKIGVHDHFREHRVFSGQSDFDPKAPKPAPDVYELAMDKLGEQIKKNLRELRGVIAVEDSVSGVTSAVRAGIPWVVGFVGGTHIPVNERIERAMELRKTGAYDVIQDLAHLPMMWVEIATTIATNKHIHTTQPRDFAELFMRAIHQNERLRFVTAA